MLWAILTLNALNLALLVVLWRRKEMASDNTAVLAAIKKARELILEATLGRRQHESVATDSVVTDVRAIKSDTNWLRSAWSRFSKFE